MTEPDFAVARLHHVQLAMPAGGEDEGRAFWSGLLGLTEVPKPAALAARGGCWFGAAGLEVHLGVERDFSPALKAHPGIHVTGIAALARHLEAEGVAVTWDESIPGATRFHCSDPFGNRLEFLEPSS